MSIQTIVNYKTNVTKGDIVKVYMHIPWDVVVLSPMQLKDKRVHNLSYIKASLFQGIVR
jgi:hypothetical protein